MYIYLLLLTVNSFVDGNSLGDESFVVREQATQKLVLRGPLSTPALVYAGYSKDLEVRMRAGVVLKPYRSVWELVEIRGVALWLFYGPDQFIPIGDIKARRLLSNKWAEWAAHLPRDRQQSLIGAARWWGLMEAGELTVLDEPGCPNDFFVGVVNHLRMRAYGYKGY